MDKIIVLGAGLVGKAIAIDLLKNFQVGVADINAKILQELSTQYSINAHQSDLAKKDNIKSLIDEYDLVIGALPGFMGFETLKTVIEAGKDIVDISFFPEDPFQLDELAKEHNVTAVVDCGVAPGMSNLILGYHNHRMQVQSFECLVGGLPVKRTWPYQYKAPFSPIDVIEEYTRPARLVLNGQVITRPALSDAELVEFEEIGTLEAFNTDGLRTLLATMNVPNMKEKTLRYPGHIEYIKVLKDTGFFDTDPVELDGTQVRPIDLSSRLLFSKWRLEEGEQEFTVMRIIIRGSENGIARTYTYDLFDRYDPDTATSSMARTTGYTCTAVANLVLKGELNRPGIIPPEYIGEDEALFQSIMEYLAARNVYYRRSEG